MALFAAWTLLALATLTAITRSPLWNTTGFNRQLAYSSDAWAASPTIAYVKTLDVNTPVVSNAPDAITILINRRAALLPPKIQTASGKPDPDFKKKITQLSAQLFVTGGVVVYLSKVAWRDYIPNAKELSDELTGSGKSLIPVHQESDGQVYMVVEKNSRSNVE